MTEQHATDTPGVEGTSDESIQQVSTKVELREDGLLWMINTTIFHPRGLTLGVDVHSGQLYLQSDASEVWVFDPDLAEVSFHNFSALIERHMAKFDSDAR